MKEAEFEVDVRPEDAQAFAKISGDWNPLHTDAAYAAKTPFRQTVLHGAFSAGLVSRMAGMYIPGTDCLLHSLQLKFLHPIIPPTRLTVRGTLVAEREGNGVVEVTISETKSGVRAVSAGYEYGRHSFIPERRDRLTPAPSGSDGEPIIFVTGASGGIGRALLARLGSRAIGFSSAHIGPKSPGDLLAVADEAGGGRPIAAIVHCGWPTPDNTRLSKLGDVAAAVQHHVSDPLSQSIALARLLMARGAASALLLFVGSTASEPGRHNFRSPLYSLSKSLLPLLTRILAVELGSSGQRCAAVVLDVVDTGMSEGMSAHSRAAHQGRSPFGVVPSGDDVADQLAWVLENRGLLLSGATISLSGGALP